MKVIFNTSFEEQIDINKIEDIYVMMDDINEKDYDIVLKHKDNFRLELNNVPSGDIKINSITVSRDYTVDYDYDTIITKNNEEETVVSILVKKVEKDPNRKKVDVTYEYIAEILGYDPTKITTNDSNNINTTNSTTNANSSTTPSSPTESDEPIVITSSSSTTTTKSEYELKEIEEAKKEEEKKQEQSKRKSIYLLILLVVIAAIIILGIVIGVKIANANK